MIKKIWGVTYWLIILAFTPCASSAIGSLEYADSLFNAKKYTTAFQYYDSLHQQGKVSPAMLLKMAFIKEGLNEVSTSLYYLNQYYIYTKDERCLSKMNQLAEKFELEGYEQNQEKWLKSIIYLNKNVIALSILGLPILLLVIFIFRFYKFNIKTYTLLISSIIIIMFGAVFLYLMQPTSKGIIHAKTCYLMAGPSAGADVIAQVRDGHRVSILKLDDIWARIKWEDQIAYVRKDQVYLLTKLNR